MTIKNVQEELNNVKKQAIDARYQAEELAQYIRRDCLEISGVPPSESYSSNDIARSVGKLIGIQVSDGDISTAHPVPTFKTDALPKIVVKFVRRDVHNRSTNFLNKLSCISSLNNLKIHEISNILNI